MKKLVFLLVLLILVSGCEVNNYNVDSIDNILNVTLSDDSGLVNSSFGGYKMYIPRGISIREKNEYNLTLNSMYASYYVYVDVVSFYYEELVEYEENEDSFYSTKIDINDKYGYVEINEIEDKYFIEIMYNYTKIEAFVNADELSMAILEISSILKSVDYQYEILDTLIGENVLNYEEIPFDIFSPKSESVDFIEYVNEYGTYVDKDNLLPNEDQIQIDEE